ncbi:hypothetical protein L1987_52177 [Smallanthus sonchifolius]|uniref:Uncharacterized protein n=1 Tax=Smallanthus sonchifolius TaxID=185202 RepID=A0ACB9ESP1_9ASTR|nr:hypothetical protein L1987_52177 [Smallanthus sonchifolius]
MSSLKTGRFYIFVHAFLNSVVKLDKPKVEKRSKNSIASAGRKTLADISNMSRTPSTLTQDNKSGPNLSTVKEYIEQLQKENTALMKLLADKKRIIDISGAELHKLSITLQKMQQQNLHLAQSNSQMLAVSKRSATSAWMQKWFAYSKKVGVRGLGPSVRKVHEGENGRLRARRQSARFKQDEPKPAEDLLHTAEMDDKMQEALPVKKEDDSLPNNESQERRRSSISRPSREVAKKVQSYKEVSLNIKMRRPE